MLLIKRIKDRILREVRIKLNQQQRQKLHNTTPSVLASNCTGAFMLHDLGLQFRSPFVNLYLSPKGFIAYLSDIAHYQSQPLQFLDNSGKPYPVGKLGDLTLHFMHYHSEQEASEKWQERSKRIDFDNLFVMLTERDGCTYQDLQAFDRLPFANKVVFTHKPYPEIASSFYIKGFEHQGEVGDLFEYEGFRGKRYYDQFDYVAWFNQAKQAG